MREGIPDNTRPFSLQGDGERDHGRISLHSKVMLSIQGRAESVGDSGNQVVGVHVDGVALGVLEGCDEASTFLGVAHHRRRRGRSV
jgi:hypothetical protein